MEAGNNDAGEEPVDEPFGHADTEQGLYKAHISSAEITVAKQVEPKQGQRPCGHYVGKHKERGDDLFTLDIGACQQPGHGTSDSNAQHSSAQTHKERVQKRLPKRGPGPISTVKNLLLPMV